MKISLGGMAKLICLLILLTGRMNVYAGGQVNNFTVSYNANNDRIDIWVERRADHHNCGGNNTTHTFPLVVIDFRYSSDHSWQWLTNWNGSTAAEAQWATQSMTFYLHNPVRGHDSYEIRVQAFDVGNIWPLDGCTAGKSLPVYGGDGIPGHGGRSRKVSTGATPTSWLFTDFQVSAQSASNVLTWKDPTDKGNLNESVSEWYYDIKKRKRKAGETNWSDWSTIAINVGKGNANTSPQRYEDQLGTEKCYEYEYELALYYESRNFRFHSRKSEVKSVLRPRITPAATSFRFENTSVCNDLSRNLKWNIPTTSIQECTELWFVIERTQIDSENNIVAGTNVMLTERKAGTPYGAEPTAQGSDKVTRTVSGANTIFTFTDNYNIRVSDRYRYSLTILSRINTNGVTGSESSVTGGTIVEPLSACMQNACEGGYITGVKLDSIDNPSSCSSQGYTDYAQTVPAYKFYFGQKYSAIIRVDNDNMQPATYHAGIWVDYNNNQSFNDPGEFVTAALNGNDIEIPEIIFQHETEFDGIRTMRVRVRTSCAFTQQEGCIKRGESGETEDYQIYLSVANQAPHINNQEFYVTEFSPLETPVGRVLASDPDPGQKVTYAIIDGNTGNMFDIGADDGYISVKGTLNSKKQSQYVLTVKVTDDNTIVPRSALAQITINLKKRPMYIQGLQMAGKNALHSYKVIPFYSDFSYQWTCSDTTAMLVTNAENGVEIAYKKAGQILLQAIVQHIPTEEIADTLYLEISITDEIVYNLPAECPLSVPEEPCMGGYIESFTLAQLKHIHSGCTPSGYMDYTQSGMKTKLYLGDVYAAELKLSYQGVGEPSYYSGIWLDYNNNGLFDDDGEFLNSSFGSDSLQYFSYLPISTNTEFEGPRRLRVRVRTSGPFLASDGCIIQSEAGETEDYLVMLTPHDRLEGAHLVTPNHDGKNDYFVIRGINSKATNHLTIFDSLGKVLFSGESYTNNWNGLDNTGKKLPPGMYYYVFVNGEDTLKGFFQLNY